MQTHADHLAFAFFFSSRMNFCVPHSVTHSYLYPQCIRWLLFAQVEVGIRTSAFCATHQYSRDGRFGEREGRDIFSFYTQ
jgi:hypothetical protein